LFAAIVAEELHQSVNAFSAAAEGGPDGLGRVLAASLSLQHVDDPGRGCAIPSLTAEVARADDSVRAAFQEDLRDIHAVLTRNLKSGEEAWALIAQSVGAVMLARAVLDQDTRQGVLMAAKKSRKALMKRGTPSA
jgi:nucleoid-associated protein YgaU